MIILLGDAIMSSVCFLVCLVCLDLVPVSILSGYYFLYLERMTIRFHRTVLRPIIGVWK